MKYTYRTTNQTQNTIKTDTGKHTQDVPAPLLQNFQNETEPTGGRTAKKPQFTRGIDEKDRKVERDAVIHLE